MTDRIKLNPPEDHKVYGPTDELCVTGCDLHLEQMSEHGFIMVINRGDEELRVSIFAPGKGRVHVRVEVEEGFADIEKEMR